MQVKLSTNERFWAKVEKSSPDECWNWQGYLNRGYGRFWNGKKYEQAHRIAYEEIKGAIPKNLVLDHLCRNPRCVNPNHLEPVSKGENNKRGVGIIAENHKKTHCLNGHEFSETNTYIYNNKRICRECFRIREENKRRSQGIAARLRKDGTAFSKTKGETNGNDS